MHLIVRQGAIIKQYAADGTNSQNWAFEKQSDGSYKIKNLTCNTYIRVEGSNNADGHEVGIKNDFGSDAFKWFIREAPCASSICPPTPVLSSTEPTNTALGSIIISNLPVGASSSLEGPLIDNPVFTPNKKLYDISAWGQYKVKFRLNGCDSEATITVMPSKSSFSYLPACYRIVNKTTGKVLTIKDASLADGAAVVLSSYTSANNQKWIVGEGFLNSPTRVTGYISKSSKNWLKTSRPNVGCTGDSGPFSVFQNKFLNLWYPLTQADGSFKIYASPGCGQAVVRAASATSSEVVVGIDDDNLSKWVLEEVSCPIITASSVQESLTFEAQAVEGRAKLQWITKGLNNVDYFNIEKLNDKAQFDILGKQNAQNTEGVHFYNFTDDNTLEGENVYRITSFFNDNTPPQYSRGKKGHFFSKTDGISIFPNPADEFINVDLRKYEGKTVALSVYNSVGLLVKKQTIEKVSAAPQQIDVQGFGTGSYLLRVQSEGKREVTRLFNITK